MKKIVLFTFLILVSQAFGDVKLPGIISDHMVLQQDKRVRIWGWAVPKETIKVELNGQAAATQANPDGTWSVLLNPMKAGGPYDLAVTGKNKIVVKDVLVGEVWVGSGQSNMAFTVGGSKDAAAEIAGANFPQIRHFRVCHEPTGSPIDEISGQWEVSNPGTAGNFTAVGYFFARYLNRELKVPVGIINSSWGGTPAEAWTPLAAMKANRINLGQIYLYEKNVPQYAEVFRQYQESLAKYEQLRKAGKLLERQQDPGNKGYDLGWARNDFVDKEWGLVDLPRTVDDLLGGDGAIWFRREVTIPETWAGHSVLVSLGSVDDYDVTYWNSTEVGHTNQKTNPTDWWVHSRKYTIPGDLVTAGRSILAVRVFDDFYSGGFPDMPENMFLKDLKTGKQISLAGVWRWKVEVKLDPAQLASPPSPPFGPNNPNAPGTLYNSMIYPLRYYPIRGAIWYQGESNAGGFVEYPKLLSTMIREWRKVWDEKDFPFGIVQLANFMARQADPNTGSAWAGLRESQYKVSHTVANTGLALAIDIGDTADIHPKNKQDVGKRLGLWALAKVYGRPVVYSGPIYRSMKVDGKKIRLSFDHVGGGLVVRGGPVLKGFSIAGADGKFVWADAKIEGDTVVVWSGKISQPVAVRYAWADNPVCNLYNKAELPACPFRTSE
jgi:sialate O-acetylesterase